MSFKQDLQRSLHHLYDLCEEEVDVDWSTDRPYLAVLFLITILIGPSYLFASWIQHWNASCPWDREAHWAGTKQFAITFAMVDALLVFYLIVFHTQILQILPRLSRILVLFNPLVWYVICALLSPTLAFILEHLDPRTRQLQRVLLPSEQPPLQPAAPTGKAQAAQPARKRRKTGTGLDSAATVLKKRKKGRPVPLGNLLLEEIAAREQQRTQIRFRPPPPEEAKASPASPSSNPTPSKQQERDKRESLKDLF